VAVVQYTFTHKQYTEQNIHNNKNSSANKRTRIVITKIITIRIYNIIIRTHNNNNNKNTSVIVRKKFI
jgi:hypothetical protein